MAKTKFASITVAIWAILFVWVQLHGRFRAPELLEVAQVYDVAFFIFPALLALIIDRRVVENIIKEPPSLFDAGMDYLIGILVGLSLAVVLFSRQGFTLLSTNTKITSFAISEMGVSSAIFTIILIQFFKVALSEEFLMSTVREVLLLNNIHDYRLYLISGSVFSSLHYYAYGITEPSAFIVAFTAGMLFTYLYIWRGWLASLGAHGTYNTLLDISQRTALQAGLLTISIYILIVVGLLLFFGQRVKIIREMRKEIVPKI